MLLQAKTPRRERTGAKSRRLAFRCRALASELA